MHVVKIFESRKTQTKNKLFRHLDRTSLVSKEFIKWPKRDLSLARRLLPAAVRENEPVLIPSKEEDQRPDPGDSGNRAYYHGKSRTAELIRAQGYLPFTWENRKFRLEIQMDRVISFGKPQKIIMGCDLRRYNFLVCYGYLPVMPGLF